jgi:hypothetical protein
MFCWLAHAEEPPLKLDGLKSVRSISSQVVPSDLTDKLKRSLGYRPPGHKKQNSSILADTGRMSSTHTNIVKMKIVRLIVMVEFGRASCFLVEIQACRWSLLCDCRTVGCF